MQMSSKGVSHDETTRSSLRSLHSRCQRRDEPDLRGGPLLETSRRSNVCETARAKGRNWPNPAQCPARVNSQVKHRASGRSQPEADRHQIGKRVLDRKRPLVTV
jgi:hypothetical protein